MIIKYDREKALSLQREWHFICLCIIFFYHHFKLKLEKNTMLANKKEINKLVHLNCKIKTV